MYELIYTSTPQGLIAGRSGFSTVALTEGFPPNLISPIENLSGYKTLFPPEDSNAGSNPVNYSCQHYHFGQNLYIVLSRISFAGLSYTGRSNVLAHHLLFTPEELAAIPGGPAAVLRAEENFTPWSGTPGMLPPKSIKKIAAAPAPEDGINWTKLAGDCYFPLYTADLFRESRPIVLSFDPLEISGKTILDLIAETSAVLSPEELLKFTFTTYCYSSAIANPPALRAYPLGSVLLESTRRLGAESVIELGKSNTVPSTWRPPGAETTEIILPEEEFDNSEILLTPAETITAAAEEFPLQEEIILEPKVPVRTAKEQKKYLPICIAFIIIAAVIAAVVWRITSFESAVDDLESPTAPGGMLQEKQPVPAPRPAIKQEKTLLPVKQEKPAAKKVRTPRPLPQAKKKQISPRPVKQKPGSLSDKELLKLHLDLRRGGEFLLPAALQKAVSLEIHLNSIGEIRNADLTGVLWGNETDTVTIYPLKEVRGDFTSRLKADLQSPSVMTLRLRSGRLSVTCPPAGKFNPGLLNISAITFSDGKKKIFTLDPRKIPPHMLQMLNKKHGRLSIKREGNGFQLIYHLSPELWLMRHHFDLVVNGRPLGGNNFTSREIPIKSLDLNELLSENIKRNALLRKLDSAEKDLAEYVSINKEKLNKPAFSLSSAARMAAQKQYEDLHAAIRTQENITAPLNALRSALVNAVQKNKSLSSDLQALADFQTRWQIRQDYVKKKNRYEDIRDRAGDLYEKQNEVLAEKLERISPAVFRKFLPILNSHKTMDNTALTDNLAAADIAADITIGITERQKDESDR